MANKPLNPDDWGDHEGYDPNYEYLEQQLEQFKGINTLPSSRVQSHVIVEIPTSQVLHDSQAKPSCIARNAKSSGMGTQPPISSK